MNTSYNQHHREKGSTSVLVAIMIPVIIGFIGLGIDVGHLFITKKQLQNNADSAAMAGVSDLDHYQTLVNSVIQSGGLQIANLQQAVRGSWDEGTKAFVADDTGKAVRVELSQTIDVYFMRLLGAPARIPVTATATANLRIAGVVAKLGASLIDIDTTKGALLNALLGNLLGTSLNLTAVGWQGLANGQLNLIQFINLAKLDLGVGTTEQLLNTNVTIMQFLDLMIQALEADNQTAALDLAVLQSQIAGLSVGALNLSLRIGDIINLDLNQGALVKADVDVLSLVSVLAEVFNHNSAVSLSTNVNLGLLNVDLRANIVEPPVIRVMQEGDTIHSAGARIYLNSQVGTLLSGLLTNSSLLNVPLYLELGSGDATLTNVSADGVDFNVGSSLAKVFLGDINPNFFFSTTTLDQNDFDQARILDASLLGIPILSADAKSYVNASGGGSAVTIPVENFGETYSVNNQAGDAVAGLVSSLLSSNNLDLNVKLLGLELNLGAVTTSLLGQLSSAVLSPLLSALLNPVSMLTGVFPGRTDLTVYDYAYEAVLVE